MSDNGKKHRVTAVYHNDKSVDQAERIVHFSDGSRAYVCSERVLLRPYVNGQRMVLRNNFDQVHELASKDEPDFSYAVAIICADEGGLPKPEPMSRAEVEEWLEIMGPKAYMPGWSTVYEVRRLAILPEIAFERAAADAIRFCLHNDCEVILEVVDDIEFRVNPKTDIKQLINAYSKEIKKH
ncbi:MAG TPA: hypothetical protein VGP72_31985 [Planctomycetota bacterium]